MTDETIPVVPSPGLTPAQRVKLALGVFLGASVLVLAVLKLVPVDTYINLIVLPGLGYIGLHTAAKTLN